MLHLDLSAWVIPKISPNSRWTFQLIHKKQSTSKIDLHFNWKLIELTLMWFPCRVTSRASTYDRRQKRCALWNANLIISFYRHKCFDVQWKRMENRFSCKLNIVPNKLQKISELTTCSQELNTTVIERWITKTVHRKFILLFCGLSPLRVY